jgi:CBS domain-containing protein
MSTKVEDVMIRDVKTANPEETILNATETMNQYEIGCMVITENGKPVGIITERDVLKRVVSKRKDPAKTRLYEIMSKPLVTVKPHITVTSAARIMIKQKIKKLLVTNGGQLVGILSLTDLIPLLREYGMTNRLSLEGAPKHVKKVFDIYLDPQKQKRKKCPLIILGGMPTNCLGPKCMWYDMDGCVFLKRAR